MRLHSRLFEPTRPRANAVSFLGVLLALLPLAVPSRAHDGDSTLVAPILQNIVIDGDLADWPVELEAHPVFNFEDTGWRGMDNNRLLGVDMATSANFSPTFKVGYSPQEQLLYLAATVRDDRHVLNYQIPYRGDLIEIYLDPDHSGGLYSDTPGGQIFQYAGMAQNAGQTFARGFNTYMFRFDITQTRSQMAFSRQGDITTYEWALEVFDHFPDQKAHLEPGRRMGFDVMMLDLDAVGDDVTWVSWGQFTFAPDKIAEADGLADLVLGDSILDSGLPTTHIAGQVVDQDGRPIPRLDLQAVQKGRIVGLARTDAGGRYHLRLRPSASTLQARPNQGYTTIPATIRLDSDQVQQDLKLTIIELPPILHKTIDLYTHLTSYRDSVEVAIDGGLETTTAAYTIRGRDRLRLEAVDWSSGNLHAIYLRDDQQLHYTSQFHQFVRQQASALEFAHLAHLMAGVRVAQQLTLAENPAELLRRGLERARHLGTERLAGKAVEVVELDYQSTQGSLPGAVRQAGSWTLRLWLDATTGAIGRVAYQLGKKDYTEYYHRADFNPPLTDADFPTAPPDGAEEALYLGEGRIYEDIVGQPAPAFELNDPKGAPVRLADYAGQVVAVDFWGTWCQPCRQAMPYLQALSETYTERDFKLIAISVPPDKAPHVQNYAAKHGLTFPLPMADDNVQQQYQVQGYPSLFFIDRQGIIRSAHIGYVEGQDSTFAAHIEELLAE
ncbi:MAG: redoxin domain-containing protein [Candidatus Latescibacteria bacterium]|nr:redoxin domain-containing protein [Candidatus Latescibacterota bacterium]